MGELVSLSERRRLQPPGPSRPRGTSTTFYFDLALPETYLAAERVDQQFEGVRWHPVASRAVTGGGRFARRPARTAVEERAAVLGLPLVWPEGFPADVRPAMRAAAQACEVGRGGLFVLAASRLAFCGGFDLNDPEVLAEAAAAAGLALEDCLSAAGDPLRDLAIEDCGRRLREMGADAVPAMRIGRVLFSGEHRMPEALAAASAASAAAAARLA